MLHKKLCSRFLPAMIGLAAIGMASTASAATVGVNPAELNLGFMNVSELPVNGGGFVFSSGWGFADLTASYTPGVLALGAAPLDDPDPFWYASCPGTPDCSGEPGNKQMAASSFAEIADGDPTFQGETVTFEFEVLSNTFVSGYTVQAFILDFTPGFGFNEFVSIPVSGIGSYSVSSFIDQGGATQWGFIVTGANVWSTDVAAQGNIEIAAVPVPAAVWLFGSGLIGLVGVARRKKAA